MIHNKRILAIIPARGGSKGVPGKNIIEVAGKPLIQYTIEVAKKSKYIDEIHVSTDDIKIKQVCEQCGVLVPRLRPSFLAQDDSKTIDVVMDVLDYYSQIKKESFDYMILLQPTQPLRQCFHIDTALEKIIESKCDSLLSVSIVEEHPVLIRRINKIGIAKPILNTNSTIRRQDFEPFHIVNGSIYINKINKNLNSSTSLNDNLLAFIMERKYHVDIDNFEDIYIFKQKLKLLQNDI